MQYPDPRQPANKIIILGEISFPMTMAGGLRKAFGGPPMLGHFSLDQAHLPKAYSEALCVSLTVHPDSQEMGSGASFVQVLILYSLGYVADPILLNLELFCRLC